MNSENPQIVIPKDTVDTLSAAQERSVALRKICEWLSVSVEIHASFLDGCYIIIRNRPA